MKELGDREEAIIMYACKFFRNNQKASCANPFRGLTAVAFIYAR
jgi:hypothetical protein